MTGRSVALLLATYNGEKYLAELLESLVCQSLKNFRVFIHDDGSSDRSLAIIDSYTNKLSMTVIASEGGLGAARSFLRLLTEAGDSFDYYFFADQDDYWYQDKMQRAVQALQQHRDNPALYCSKLELVDSQLNHICFTASPRIFSLRNALVENVATGCTVAINRATYKLATQSNPNSIIMHDWWLYLIVSAFGTIIYDEVPSIKYRQHGGNAVGSATSSYQEVLRRVRRFLSKKKTGVFRVSEQAEEFMGCYGHLLSNEQLALVKSLASASPTLLGRMELAFRSDFVRQKRLDTVALRALFALGRF